MAFSATPTYESQTSVPASPLPRPAPTESPFAAGLEAAAIGFGRIVEQQEIERERLRRASEAAWVTQASADAELSWRKKLAESSEAVETGQATGFADRFNTDYSGWMQDQLRTAPSDEARLALQGSLLSLRNNLYSTAATWENGTVVAEQAARFEGTFGSIAQLAATTGDIDGALRSFEQSLAIADRNFMDGATVEKWRIEGPTAIRTAWLQGLVASDPKAAAAALGMQPATPALPGGAADMNALIEAQIFYESRGKPDAEGPVTHTGERAIGLMQVMPATAREMAIELGMRDVAQMSDEALIDWLKVEDNNKLVGGRYLDKMLKRYGGNRTLALAAYNAGPGTVDEWLARIGDPRSGAVSDAQFAAAIPYTETRTYVGNVLARAGGSDAGAVQVASLDSSSAGAVVPALHPALATLPIDVVAQMRSEVTRALAEDQAQLAAVVDTRIQDESAAALWGKPVATPVSYAEVVEAHGPIEGPAIWNALEEDRRFGRDLQTIALMPPEDQAALLAGYEPEGEGFAFEAERFTALQKALAEDAKRREDPALYVMQYSPDLQKLYAAATAQNAPDGAMDTYIATSLRLQERAGIAEPRILSTDQAEQIVAALKDPKPIPAGAGQPAVSAAERMAFEMTDLAESFGKNWGPAYDELIEAGLPPEFIVLATTDDPRARVMLGEAFMADPAQLKASVGTDAVRAIEEAIATELGEFAQINSVIPNGERVTGAYTDAVTRLALVYARRYGAERAAQKAANDLVNGARHFLIEDDFLLSIPTGTSRADVEYTAEQMLAGLTVDSLMVPGDTAVEAAMLGGVPLTAQQRREDNLAAVLHSHIWVTNEDETGSYLLDFAGNPVMRVDGSRIEMRFDALMKPPVRTVPTRGGFGVP